MELPPDHPRSPRAPRSATLSLLLALCLAITPRAAAAPVELELNDWSDQRLFDSALAAWRNGDCAWTLRVYRVLLGRDIDPQLRVWSLYNQGLCLERGRFYDEAAESYGEIVRDHPEESTARDALFRLAQVHEWLKRYDEAERLFREVLKRYPDLEPSDRRAVEVQIAWEQLLQGQEKAALRRLNRVVRTWEAMPAEERYAEREAVAQARVALGMLLSRKAGSIDFERPGIGAGYLRWKWARVRRNDDPWLRRRLADRERWMIAARAQYEEAMRQKTPRWTSAAWYQLGMDIEAYYRAVNEAPPPISLTPPQREQYRTLLRERTGKYLEEASRLYHKGNNQAVSSDDDSEWADRLKRKVALIEQDGVEALGK